MPELVKRDDMAQGVVLGWSFGRDPETRARAYLARWIPLQPGVKTGSELPVHSAVYQARIRASSRLGLLCLLLAGPLAGLAGLLPEGRYVSLAVLVVGLFIGAAWWRRSPSIWERGAFVRMLNDSDVPQPATSRPATTPAPQVPPLMTPLQAPPTQAAPPVNAYAPTGTVNLPPPPSSPTVNLPSSPTVNLAPPLPTPTVPESSPFDGVPAVPRSPVSRTPDWSAREPETAVKTPSWAPTDSAPPGAPSGQKQPSAFDTVVGSDDTRPPTPTSSEAAAGAELVVDAGPDAGRTIRAKDAWVRVGRAPDNDAVFADPRTSRHHAQLELRGGRYWIVDLGSANGTQVNGERITERALNHGDLIRIGQNKLSFHILNAEMSLV